MFARRHAQSPVPFALIACWISLASSFGMACATSAQAGSVSARRLEPARGPEPAGLLSRGVTTSASAKRSLLGFAAPAVASSSAGPFALSCPSVDLVLDGFGALGSSTAGADAQFRADGATFGTIFESMAFARGAGFLEGLSLALPQSASGAHRNADGVSASFVAGPWRFELHSALENCASEQATLRQAWSITNIGSGPELLAFTLYLDGDLFARGTEDDDFGARVGGELIVFDEGADRDQATAFLGLSSQAPEALRIHREVGEFSEQRRRVARSAFVTNRLVRADGSRADADGDGVTDVGFDVSLAIAHDFGTLAPGQSRHLVARIRWGVGSIHDVVERSPIVDAGADRILECEGGEGTLVRLDATTSADAARITEWAWGVDGVVVGREAAVELLLLPGRHVVSVEGIDAQGRIGMDEAIVEILDTTPPLLEVGAALTLWPPDHRLVPVNLPVLTSDGCSGVVSLVPVGVTSDERDDARGDGRSSDDAQLSHDGTLLLRAERSGRGDGRVYHVLVEARDAAGNLALADFRVDVPHDARGSAVDSGAAVEIEL